ncbi:conserved hypothetical protein [Trichinella spiralis]|uniref:hypothetical protein n=1 Tax=Trichinella spiralis TaxID=6334 RepID=UPI0001EFB51B|nr:conserved hypothetical protein [Trichinella spiralis]
MVGCQGHHCPQRVQGVVQAVHATPFSGVGFGSAQQFRSTRSRSVISGSVRRKLQLKSRTTASDRSEYQKWAAHQVVAGTRPPAVQPLDLVKRCFVQSAPAPTN